MFQHRRRYQKRSYAAGRFAFGIDGQFTGYIKKVSGDTYQTEIDKQALGTTLVQKKHLATLANVEISMDMDELMWDWIKDSWDQNFTPRDYQLITADFDHEVQAIREFSETYIKRVRIPAMDVDNPEPGYFNVTLESKELIYYAGFNRLNIRRLKHQTTSHKPAFKIQGARRS